MDYTSLKAIGVKQVEDIEKYTLRSERDQDVLKIYHAKKKGELFHRSEKFKFPRSIKVVRGETSGGLKERSEVSAMLTSVLAELDKITNTNQEEKTAKELILSDLRHLEKVVASKIAEIEKRLDEL